jgi:uncharacterized protein (TIGR02246 family)
MAVAALAMSALLPGTAGAEPRAVTAIEGRLDQYAARFNREDAEALAQLFSEEVVYYGPLGQIFEGRDAVEQRYRSSFEAGFSDMAIETLEVEVLGDTAWDIARYTVHDPSGKPLVGYHLAILNRVDGEWIVQRTLVNAVMPQPPG